MFRENILFNSPKIPILVRDGALHSSGAASIMHFHSEFEFLYIKSGILKCIADDNEFILNPGDVIFINSKVLHQTFCLTDNTSTIAVQFRNFSFRNDTLYYLYKFSKRTDIPAFVMKKGDRITEEMSSYILRILSENTDKSTAYDYYLTANMHMMVGLLYRNNVLTADDTITSSNHIKQILPVLEYIENNFESEIHLETLCGILNLTKCHFCRTFKKITGGTPTEYLNFVRICKSESMLKTDMSISSIAYAVGFSSLSYFNRVFKKHKACSPQAYRRMRRNADNPVE